MRISTSTLYGQLTDKLSTNAADLAKLQGQISSGKKYAVPSEAPELVGHVQSLESQLKTLDADAKAVAQVKVGVDAQSQALEGAATLLNRLKEITMQGATDPQPKAVLDSLAEEVKGIKSSLVDLANAKDSSDRYVFGGERSGALPYVLNKDGSVSYVGSNLPLRVRIGDASYEDASTPGTTVWHGITKDGEAVDMFAVLTNYEQALRSGNVAGRQEAIKDVSALSDNMGVAIAKSGASQQRLDLMQSQAQATSVTAQKSLSDAQDLDFAAAMAQLQKQQLLMQAAQSLLGKLNQLSLLDVIR